MNLIEGIQQQIKRVTEIKKEYDEVPNGAGRFASLMMSRSIERAEASIAFGDVVEMLAAHQELAGYEL